jgi:DNA-binding beta-propeller fold protein YncE
MDEIEQRVQSTLQRPTVSTSAPDVESMLTGVRRGVRLRRLRRTVIVAAAVVLAVVGAVSLGEPLLSADPRPASETPGTPEGEGVTEIDMGMGGPCCLVARDDGVWVMNLRDETIQRIDPDTNEPDEPIDVSPSYKMIDAGEKMLLEGDYSVTLFDPETATVGRSIAVEGGVRGMVYDSMSNTAWVGSATDGTLTGIDAESGRVVDTLTIDGLPNGGDLVMTGNNELWVATFDGEILKVDLAERSVVTRLRRFVGNEVSIAAAGGYLWATSVEQPTLSRINPDTGQVVERGDIDAAGAGFPGVATSPDGTLWVAAAPDRIEERDPQTGQTLKSYDIPLDDDVHINEYFRNSSTTGFGSVWTTTFDKYSFDHAVVRLER